MKHQKKLALLVGALVVMAAATAKAVPIDWPDKLTAVVDGTFEVKKPNDAWDTQKTSDSLAPVKWVLHRSGANPIIWLRYDPSPQGKTAHHFAQYVKKDLEQRGITVEKIQNKVINGRNVSIISGEERGGKLRYLVAVYRNKVKGLMLECTAAREDFGVYSAQFWQAIESVRILREN
jgi:uncharacterized protein Usg